MNRDLVKGVAIGLGVAVLAPIAFPVIARVARPAMKAAIKAGVTAYERGRESLAEMGEYAEDMVAEVRTQRAQETGGGQGAREGDSGFWSGRQGKVGEDASQI